MVNSEDRGMGAGAAERAESSRALAGDLADGRLHGDVFARAVQAVCADRHGARAWHMAHLIGDAMRSRELAGRCLDEGFAQAVQNRLAVEVFDPASGPDDATVLNVEELAPIRRHHHAGASGAANSTSAWSWRLAAGVGAMGVALAVAFSLGGYWNPGGQAGQVAQGSAPAELALPASVAPLAQAPAAVAPAVPAPKSDMILAGQQAAAPVMIRDPRLDELLAAHRQAGGTSALQKPAGFFRNAAHQDDRSR